MKCSYRIIALDVGDRWVGIAISDTTCTIATALATLDRTSINFWQELSNIIQKKQVSKVIIGLPIKENGKYGPQAKKVISFRKHMEKKLHNEVEYLDERYTSKIAEDFLRTEFKMSKRQQKKIIDRIAAVLILEDYLKKKSIER